MLIVWTSIENLSPRKLHCGKRPPNQSRAVSERNSVSVVGLDRGQSSRSWPLLLYELRDRDVHPRNALRPWMLPSKNKTVSMSNNRPLRYSQESSDNVTFYPGTGV